MAPTGVTAARVPPAAPVVLADRPLRAPTAVGVEVATAGALDKGAMAVTVQRAPALQLGVLVVRGVTPVSTAVWRVRAALPVLVLGPRAPQALTARPVLWRLLVATAATVAQAIPTHRATVALVALAALAVSLAMAVTVVWVVLVLLPPPVHLPQAAPGGPGAMVAHRAMVVLVVPGVLLPLQVTTRKSLAVWVAAAVKVWLPGPAVRVARQRLQALLSMRQAAQGGMPATAPTSQGLAALAAQVDLLPPPGQATSWRSVGPVAMADPAPQRAAVGLVAVRW